MSLNSFASTVPILVDELTGPCKGVTESGVPLEFTQPAAVSLHGKGLR
jgi:hypothetical protein